VCCGDIVNDLFIFHVFNEPKAKDLEFGELGGEHGLLDTDRRYRLVDHDRSVGGGHVSLAGLLVWIVVVDWVE